LRNEEKKGGEGHLPALVVLVSSFLPCQRDFDGADVRWSTSLFACLRWQLLRADVDCLYFDVWQESAPDYLDNVDCAADGSSSGLDVDFWCGAMEESYAS
jgi:hypothetical protein